MNLFPLYQSLGSPLPTPAEMAEWDRNSIREFGIPGMLLMENASREAFHAINALLPPERRVLVLMGGGNNGGDGACLARHLLDAGHSVLVCHMKPLDSLPEDARAHARIARAVGTPFAPVFFVNNELAVPPEYGEIARSPHAVIDALLGTGFSGPLREPEREAVRFVNRLGETVPVFSLDIPSGLDGITGAPCPEAVRATHTVSFEAAKPGLVMPQAARFTGTLHIRPIGIPRAAQARRPASFYRLEPRERAWPPAEPGMHKGQAGRVLILGGSAGLTGAPALAALGALRAGAGLVTVACPGALEPQVRSAFPEMMTRPLGQGDAWT
ncbi:MAG: NAD(P)H-hydrate epimerase, partial [Deltaproteobacteria bacterium]|nr:NAD(P)H-hydrate epimerase [Deltaproteobacteria bacterium]